MMLAALALSISGPSFDCAKASTDAEKMICADEGLAAADRAVAKLYRAVPRSERKNLFGKQDDWLADRDRCADKPCLVAAYESRLIDVFIGARGMKTRDYERTGNPSGSLSILDVGDGWSAFFVESIWQGSVPTAIHNNEVTGVFRLIGGRASRPPTEDDCGWRIRRLSRDRWKLEHWPKSDDQFPCGAENASIEGIYRR